LSGDVQVGLIDIAESDDLDRRDLDQAEDVGLAVPPAADQADPDWRPVREWCGVAVGGRERQTGGARLQKITTIHSTLPDSFRAVPASEDFHSDTPTASVYYEPPPAQRVPISSKVLNQALSIPAHLFPSLQPDYPDSFHRGSSVNVWAAFCTTASRE